MKLININGAKIEIEAAALFIKEFAEIWNADKSKDKAEAYKHLSIVYFAGDYKSVYSKYSDEEKLQELSRDLLGGKPIPDIVLAAIEKYKQLNTSRNMAFLLSARNTVDKMKSYLDEVDFSETVLDAKGNEKDKYDIDKVQKVILNFGKTIETLDKLEEKVAKEKSIDSKTRADATPGDFEDGFDDEV